MWKRCGIFTAWQAKCKDQNHVLRILVIVPYRRGRTILGASNTMLGAGETGKPSPLEVTPFEVKGYMRGLSLKALTQES